MSRHGTVGIDFDFINDVDFIIFLAGRIYSVDDGGFYRLKLGASFWRITMMKMMSHCLRNQLKCAMHFIFLLVCSLRESERKFKKFEIIKVIIEGFGVFLLRIFLKLRVLLPVKLRFIVYRYRGQGRITDKGKGKL
ncbi:hypothetical protein L6452_08553 [Arctium lappa]|uniref:Uncharacterized protein n=1 Tax=Arctium lappa TaxID=4217 RepID=A0ACB9DI21_ARCLA|nr:hypothetical protein L6452_08553 [Arctium lappa]